MKLFGIDPGKSTGYAALNTSTMEIEYMATHEHTPFKMLDLIEDAWDHHTMVVERFVPRFGQAFDCTPMYLIGALQGQYDEEINLVMPATHKGGVPRDKVTRLMKAQGFKVGAGHSRDALSLCLYWAGFKLKDKYALAFLAEEG